MIPWKDQRKNDKFEAFLAKILPNFHTIFQSRYCPGAYIDCFKVSEDDLIEKRLRNTTTSLALPVGSCFHQQ